MRLRFFLILVMTVLALQRPLFAADDDTQAPSDLPVENIFARKPSEVDVVADSLEYARDQKKVIAKDNVVVRYKDLHLTADYAEVETDTKKAHARGHVYVFKKEKVVAHGHEIHFDFENEVGSFPDGRTANYPWFSSGEDIQQVKKGVKKIRNGVITTCDRENPHYAIKAKRVTIHDQDKMVARKVTIYALGKPIFWWPYLVIPLRENQEAPFGVNVGHRSQFGYYIETFKGIGITDDISGKIRADWRSKRGFGGGGDLYYNYGKRARGILQGYWTQDKEAPTPASTDNAFHATEKRDRGRLTWRHRTNIDDYSQVMMRYNRLADEFFLQEFFEKEFRAEVEPQSFISLTKNSNRYGSLVHFEKRMNRFESMVERMPEVRLDWKRQPFLNPKVFYESQASFSNMAKRLRRQVGGEEASRFDTVHQWSLPVQWRHIKVTPFVFGRATTYSRSIFSDSAEFRWVPGYGTDLRTHFYRTLPVSFDKFGIEMNQLRHIFEPSIQYQGTRSTVSDETIYHFDSIDRIDDADVVTFGFENRLQTKRMIRGKMQRVDVVSLNTFLNYEFNPDGFSKSPVTVLNQEGGSQTASAFTIWNQEVVVRPYDWLQYELRMDYDMKGGSLRVLNQDIIAHLKKFRFLMGQRIVHGEERTNGNHQLIFETDFQLNTRWSLGGYTLWNPDQEELEEWQVFATRDLHDFLLDLGYNVRNSAIRNSNSELFFNFRLKAFPEYNLHSGQRASFASPRIGETVAGSTSAPVPPSRFLPETYVSSN